MVERFPGSPFLADFGHWRHFIWIPGSFLGGQGSFQFFKLQLEGISHWNLVSIAYQFQCLMAFHFMMVSEQ